MTIYYIDPAGGDDGNTGLSWGQAWRTSYPIKGLYGHLGSVQGIELRFAKTLPIETARGITFSAPALAGYADCRGVARPHTGYRKVAIPDYFGASAKVSLRGGTVLAPFLDAVAGVSTYNTFKLQIEAPALADGLAARWALADGDFSSFHCFEAVAAFTGWWGQSAAETPVSAEAWLEFSTDMAGSNIVWSRKLDAGDTRYRARLSLLGDGDLPTGASYAFIRIRNLTNTAVYLNLSSVWAVLPSSHANYAGLRLAYLPNSRFGLPLTPVGASGDISLFNGLDGPAVDSYYATQTLPARTWSTYVWERYPYACDALLPSCRLAGSPSAPLLLRGGWNPLTGEVDGVSVLDAANLRLFWNVRRVSVDVRDIAVVFRRSGMPAYDDEGYLRASPGVMEEAAYIYKVNQASYAERVYLPAGGAGCVLDSIGWSEHTFDGDSLLGHLPIVGDSYASFSSCWAALAAPFSRNMHYTEAVDSTLGMSGLYGKVQNPVVERCVMYGCRPSSSEVTALPATSFPPTYNDCDIVSPAVNNSRDNGYVCAPVGTFKNTRLWGAYTGPVSSRYAAENLTYFPMPGVLGPVCTGGIDVDGFSCTHAEPTFYTSSPMFSGSSAAAPVSVSLANATIHVTFASMVSGTLADVEQSHRVRLREVVIHKTDAVTGAPFAACALDAQGLTLVGSWVALQSGRIFDTEVRGLVITDAGTRVLQTFLVAGPSAGWGRVRAVYRDIVHPSGAAGFVGTPAASIPSYVSGAAWLHSADAELWTSEILAVTRDPSVHHTGASSWRLVAYDYAGALSRCSFPVGVIPVIAGAPVVFSVKMRRASRDVLGGVFLRPGTTREFAPTGTASPPSLADIAVFMEPSTPPGTWCDVQVMFTPVRDGLVELHAGLRGVPGHAVWLDSLKVSQ